MKPHHTSVPPTKNAFTIVPSLITLLLLLPCSLTLFGQGDSQISQNKEVVIKYLDTFNTHDLSKISQLFAKDYVWHTLDGREIHSAQDSSHMVTLRFVTSAIPDIYYSVESIIGEGDLVAVNTTVTGSVEKPTGAKRLRFKQMFFFRVSQGLIQEEWEVLDTGLMMQQMAD